jgi:hypothetical protein
MIIFLKNIPRQCDQSDISYFVEPALKRSLFKRAGKILNVEILTLRDIQLNSIEQHALVTVEPEGAAIRAIKRLKGRRLKNKPVIVRQYFHRSWRHDRRDPSASNNYDAANKRKSDRRRGKNLEKVKQTPIHFSSHADFARKQWVD